MAVIIYDKNDKKKLSENFKVYEFSCKGNGCCSTVKIDSDLVKYVQKIRDHFKKPLVIGSGYRCPTYNSKVLNAAKQSKHTMGMAADISIKGVAPAEIAKYAESLGIKGIGLYDTFVHIDTRKTKFFWYSHAQEPRTTFGGKAPEQAVTKPTTSSKYTRTQFIKDIQKAFGAKVDGVAGPDTLAKTKTLSAKKNRKHAAVKYVQKYLLALGYKEVGTADGVAGDKFTAAVIHFQKDKKCTADGEITAKATTWKKLLGLA